MSRGGLLVYDRSHFSVSQYINICYQNKREKYIPRTKFTLSISTTFPKTSTCPVKSEASYAEGERRNVRGVPRKDGNAFFLYIGKNRMKMSGNFFL
jgi:hypothetical protein